MMDKNEISTFAALIKKLQRQSEASKRVSYTWVSKSKLNNLTNKNIKPKNNLDNPVKVNCSSIFDEVTSETRLNRNFRKTETKTSLNELDNIKAESFYQENNSKGFNFTIDGQSSVKHFKVAQKRPLLNSFFSTKQISKNEITKSEGVRCLTSKKINQEKKSADRPPIIFLKSPIEKKTASKTIFSNPSLHRIQSCEHKRNEFLPKPKVDLPKENWVLDAWQFEYQSRQYESEYYHI